MDGLTVITVSFEIRRRVEKGKENEKWRIILRMKSRNFGRERGGSGRIFLNMSLKATWDKQQVKR